MESAILAIPLALLHQETLRFSPRALPFVILFPVRYLYGVLILSTMALVWAAWAVVRYVRQQRTEARSHAEPHDENL